MKRPDRDYRRAVLEICVVVLLLALAILLGAHLARAAEPATPTAATPSTLPFATPAELAALQAAAAEQAAKPVSLSTKLTNWTGKNPWIWAVFWGAVGIDTVLRGIWPSRKARPKVVTGIIALVALPALNLWIIVRVVVEGTAARFGYKLKLRLPSESDGCPNPECPAGCPAPSGSGVLALPDPNAIGGQKS